MKTYFINFELITMAIIINVHKKIENIYVTRNKIVGSKKTVTFQVEKQSQILSLKNKTRPWN